MKFYIFDSSWNLNNPSSIVFTVKYRNVLINKQFYTLSGRIGKLVASHAEGYKVARSNIPAVAELHRFILCTRRSGGTAKAFLVLPMRVGRANSQLYLPSLTPFSVAGCGRLKLGVLHWATSVITASS